MKCHTYYDSVDPISEESLHCQESTCSQYHSLPQHIGKWENVGVVECCPLVMFIAVFKLELCGYLQNQTH